MSKSLYLIDGHAQIFRAYYAPFSGSLSSPDGEPTKATHVFTQMLLNLIRDRQPDYLAVTLDADESKLHRLEIFPEYKGNRESAPEDFGIQVERIIEILESAKIPTLQRVGWEADDIAATVSKRLAGPELHVYLVSRDKDLEQLLSAHITMFDPFKGEEITPASLKEKKGWTPEQAIEIQTLSGDSTDNIPGVKGIGPKTALKLIDQYGSAAAVLEHADELTPKQRENVLAFADQIDITRQLVTLSQEVPIELHLPSAECERFDWATCVPVMQRLGFRRLIEQLPASGEAVIAPVEVEAEVQSEAGEYTLINTPEALADLAKQLASVASFAFDTETTSVITMDAELVGLSFSWETGQGCYVPVQSQYGQVLSLDLVREVLGPVLANATIEKIGHNLKYDLLVCRNHDLPVAGQLFDTMIAAFLLYPERNSFSMDRLVRDLLRHEMIPISELIGKGRDQLRMDQVPVEHVSEYASEDADFTWRMAEKFRPELEPAGVQDLFEQVEMPLVSVLTEMEFNGVAIDADLLAEMSKTMAGRAHEITDEVHGLAGRVFNLDSPKQLAEVLFDELEFRVVRKTKTSRSTDADTLEVLARETGHELPRLMLDYRELQKLRGTYLDALPKDRSKRTGRIHTSYHQTGAITGRLSSSEPNLQNIPIRSEQGREIRRAFVPRSPDERLIAADYSQVELRILAHFSEDDALIQAFAEDRDIHAFVAAQVNGVELKEVSREMRANAKAVNFGIIYGQTAFGLANATGMSRGEAQAFIDGYFDRYPKIRAFIDQCVTTAKTEGSVRTILGRRRPILNIDSRNAAARAQAERLAVNTVVQGSAADLIKKAMVQLDRRIRDEDLPLRMLLQVHDELVCEAPLGMAEAMSHVMVEVMSGAMEFRVPLKVDVAVGENWLAAK
jgi:DNA polymerase-1